MVGEDNRSPYSQAQPFVRNRIDKNGYTSVVPSTVDRENRLLQQKIQSIKHRPSSASQTRPHASANDSADSSAGPIQPWESFKVQSHIQASTGKVIEKQRDRQIQQDNLVLYKKLQERYGIRNDSFVVANHLGTGVDCNSRWQQRTSLYGCSTAGNHAASCSSLSIPSTAPALIQLRGPKPGQSSTGSQVAACSNSSRGTGVPKTLGVASCAGEASRRALLTEFSYDYKLQCITPHALILRIQLTTRSKLWIDDPGSLAGQGVALTNLLS